MLEHLKEKRLVEGNIERVVFNEVAKNAILQAMDQPRDLDTELIDAYRACRALIIWSAFRYRQCCGVLLTTFRRPRAPVALRLICEREAEIGFGSSY